MIRYVAWGVMTITAILMIQPATTAEEGDEPYATLYVMDDSGKTLFGGKITLKDNGKKMAKLARRQYTIIRIEPGRHVLTTTSKKPNVVLDAVEGETYYLVYAYRPGYAIRGLLLKLVDREEAESLLALMEKVEPAGDYARPREGKP